MKGLITALKRFSTNQAIYASIITHHASRPASHSALRPLSTTCTRNQQLGAVTSTTNNYQSNRRPKRHLKARVRVIVLTGIGLALGFTIYSPSLDRKIFDPPRFTPFMIIDRQEVSSTCIILTVRPQNISTKDTESDPYASWWDKGTWSVEVKQPQLQIARAYTPLPPREGDKNGDLRFLIRKESNGEVSGYLHKLGVGEVLEMRGPKLELELRESLTDVVFLAGGTGIAPAMQLAYILLKRQGKDVTKPKIQIVWANRKREDCMGGYLNSRVNITSAGQIVAELQSLQKKYPDQLVVEYVVDEEKTFLDRKKISQLTRATSVARTNDTNPNLLVLSGPEGFVSYFAGPKLWEGKDGQGKVGGIVGGLDLKSWTVWKL